MLGAQVGDDLGRFLITERVGEGRHLLSAVENLVSHFVDGPLAFLADVDEGRSFLGSGAVCAVAMGTAFVAKEDGAGDLLFFVFVTPGRAGGEWKGCGQEQGGGKKAEVAGSRVHREYFRIRRGRFAPSKVGGERV